VLLVLFVLQERRAAEPLVPMQLFAIRAATLSWMVGFFASFQIISLSVLVPLRCQAVTGAGADSAALHMLPLAMGVPIGAYCCGRLTTILGRYKPQIVAGALLLPCAVAGLALVTPSSFWLSWLFMLLCGTAAGTQFPTSLVAAQSAVSHSHLGVATSNTTLFRSLGGAVGVALMSAILLAMLQPLAAGQGFGPTASPPTNCSPASPAPATRTAACCWTKCSAGCSWSTPASACWRCSSPWRCPTAACAARWRTEPPPPAYRQSSSLR